MNSASLLARLGQSSPAHLSGGGPHRRKATPRHNRIRRRETGTLKYRIVFGLAVAALVTAGLIVVFSYQQHMASLQQGNKVGAAMMRLGLMKDLRHVQR